ERRTAERLVHGRDWSRAVAQIAAVRFHLAHVAVRRGGFHRLHSRRQGADDGGAHRELDARKTRLLGLPAGHPPFGIMRLDPALEKARRYRQLDGVALAAVEFHAGKPTRVHVVTDFGAKAVLHARPAVQIHACHLGLFLLLGTNDGNADETRYFDAKWHERGNGRRSSPARPRARGG